MRKYRIVVNGSAYEVEVEELAAGAPSQVQAAPQPAPVAAPQAAPAPVAAAPAPAPAAAGSAGSEMVKAPMPGTILSISASVGAQVKKGDVLLILEAMKMENEIMSPVDGTIASVNVASGAQVNTGDTLITLN